MRHNFFILSSKNQCYTMFSNSDFDLILSYVIVKRLRVRDENRPDILQLRDELFHLIGKVPQHLKRHRVYQLRLNAPSMKLNLKYNTPECLRESAVYTYFLVANLYENLATLPDLDEEEMEVKNLLKLDFAERNGLMYFSDKIK